MNEQVYYLIGFISLWALVIGWSWHFIEEKKTKRRLGERAVNNAFDAVLSARQELASIRFLLEEKGIV
jgi:hypothetical protein